MYSCEGWDFIKSKKIDIMRIVDSMILHQEIERRDGLIFMKMKKKSQFSIK